MTVRDVYTIPRMDKCIDNLVDAQVFSTLDANSGYWQILIATKDCDKTTSTTYSVLTCLHAYYFELRTNQRHYSSHRYDLDHSEVVLRPRVLVLHHILLVKL